MSDSLRKVSIGLKLVFYGVVLILVTIGVGVAGMCVLIAGAGPRGPGGGGPPAAGMAGFVAFAVALGLLALAANILGLVGKVLCIAVPKEFGAAKTLIVTAVVMEVAAIGVNGLGIANAAAGGIVPPPFDGIANLLSMLLNVGGSILFLFFIRAVARAIDESSLAADATSVLWLSVAAVGCYITAVGVMVAGMLAGGGFGGPRPNGGAPPAAMAGVCVGGVFVLAALVLGLIAFVRYLFLLTRMSTAVGQYAGSAGDGDEEADDGESRGGVGWGVDPGFDVRGRGDR